MVGAATNDCPIGFARRRRPVCLPPLTNQRLVGKKRPPFWLSFLLNGHFVTSEASLNNANDRAVFFPLAQASRSHLFVPFVNPTCWAPSASGRHLVVPFPIFVLIVCARALMAPLALPFFFSLAVSPLMVISTFD